MLKDFRKNFILYIIAGYIFLLGLSYIFSVVLGIKNHDIARTVGSPTQSVLLGIGLVYLSSSLKKRLFRAWLITFILVLIALVREFVLLDDSLDLTNIVLLLIALTSLYLVRQQFKVAAEAVKLRGNLLIAGVLLITAVVYGSVGFSLLPRRDFNRTFTLEEGFVETLKEYSLTTVHHLAPMHNPRAEAFLLSLRSLGVASVLLAGYSLLQPLIYKREHQDSGYNQAKELLEKYGEGSEDYFKLWPNDKDYFFNSTGRSALAYKVRRRVAIIFSDPFGDPTTFKDLVVDFKKYTERHSLDVTFIHITDKYRSLYEDLDFTLQKIGEEAVIDLRKFSEETLRDKKWRHVSNKFDKLGYRFELRQPPHSDTFLDELERISNDWLQTPGRVERGFVMGYFDRQYLGSCPIGVLRNSEQQIVSFVNMIESYDDNEANIDLFRQRKDSPTNLNDYMISQVLITSYQHGFRRFNLGLCPLSGMEDEDQSSATSKALHLVYSYGSRFYSFKGLQQFKSKFDPEWRERYIAYQGSAVNLFKIAQAINSAMRLPK